ncbi:MAG: hypothetical protein ACE366_00415 [Bradymonadia bacterium]
MSSTSAEPHFGEWINWGLTQRCEAHAFAFDLALLGNLMTRNMESPGVKTRVLKRLEPFVDAQDESVRIAARALQRAIHDSDPYLAEDALSWMALLRPVNGAYPVVERIKDLMKLGASKAAWKMLDEVNPNDYERMIRLLKRGTWRRDDPNACCVDLRRPGQEAQFPMSFSLWARAVDLSCEHAAGAGLLPWIKARQSELPKRMLDRAEAWSVRILHRFHGVKRALSAIEGLRQRSARLLALDRAVSDAVARGCPREAWLLLSAYPEGARRGRAALKLAPLLWQAGATAEARKALQSGERWASTGLYPPSSVALARARLHAVAGRAWKGMEVLETLCDDYRALSVSEQQALGLAWVEVWAKSSEDTLPDTAKRSVYRVLFAPTGHQKVLNVFRRLKAVDVSTMHAVSQLSSEWRLWCMWLIDEMGKRIDGAVDAMAQTSGVPRALVDEQRLVLGMKVYREGVRRASLGELRGTISQPERVFTPAAQARLRVLSLLKDPHTGKKVAHLLDQVPQGHPLFLPLTKVLEHVMPKQSTPWLLTRLGPESARTLRHLVEGGVLPEAIVNAWLDLGQRLYRVGVDPLPWLRALIKACPTCLEAEQLRTIAAIGEWRGWSLDGGLWLTEVQAEVDDHCTRSPTQLVETLSTDERALARQMLLHPPRLPRKSTPWTPARYQQSLKAMARLSKRINKMRLMQWGAHLEGDVARHMSALHMGRWPGQGPSKMYFEDGYALQWLDKCTDILTWPRLADATHCCFSSESYSYNSGMQTAQWLWSLWADPLSVAMQILDPDGLPVGFAFGGYGLLARSRPVLLLSGIYLSESNKRLRKHVIRALKHGLAPALGLQGLVMPRETSRRVAQEVELERWRALDQTSRRHGRRLTQSIYDDLGEVVNRPYSRTCWVDRWVLPVKGSVSVDRADQR